MTGTIKRLMDKGYGFIACEDSEKDVFFHTDQLVDVTFEELKEGDKVTFDIEETPKGKSALNVKKV